MSFNKIVFSGLFLLVASTASPLYAEDGDANSSHQLRVEIKQLDLEKSKESEIEQSASASVEKLRELISSIGHLKRSAYDLFCETQREDLVVVGEPNVIGPMIVPAIPDGSGLLNTGQLLPPRKKWVDYYMAQIEKLYPMVTGELEGLKLSKNIDGEAREHYRNMVTAFNKLGPALKDLDKKTLGPDFDNQVIAQATAVAQKYADTLEKESKRLYRDLKKIEKQSKKEEKKIERQLKKDKKLLEKENSSK